MEDIPQNRDGFVRMVIEIEYSRVQYSMCPEKRKAKGRDIQLNYFWKEINNSTYGKLAQGLRDRLFILLKKMC